MATKGVIPAENIASPMYLLRGQTVMLDSDLAELYGVNTSALNQQAKRNLNRSPDDPDRDSPDQDSPEDAGHAAPPVPQKKKIGFTAPS